MKTLFPENKKLARTAKVALLAAMTIVPAMAQTTNLFGSLGNFDVYNDTGQDAHGFQIELDGVQAQQVPYTFNSTRYGGPTIIPFAGGVYVRYAAQWDPQAMQFTATTAIPAA